MPDINLGHATAYGYAKSKGYTGTEEEFAQLMANYAVIGQTATQAAQTATTKASEAAASAASAAQSAEEMDILEEEVDTLALEAEGYVNDGYVEDGVAYFVHNGEVLFEITGIGGGGGGGGGGSGNNAILTVANTTGWLSKTIAGNSTCTVSFTWSSLEDDLPTGDGSLKILVNGAVKATNNIQQGNISREISAYLSAGSNSVKMQVSDVYGNTRTITFSINVVDLSITSSFSALTPFSSEIAFQYIPYGAVSKTVYFILDGTQIGTQTTSYSGRQLTYTIPAQDHGSHTLRVYLEATIDGESVTSNELYYEFMSIEDGNGETIITSQFNTSEINQYESVVIPFMVYTPLSATSQVTISVNNTVVSEQTVDRAEQLFTYRAEGYGEVTIVISSNEVSKTIEFTVNESGVIIEPETEDLTLYLSSQGRSNNDDNPESWTFGNIETTFSGFNGSSDRWQKDDDGITVCRVSGDARLNIAYQPFARDFRTTGKTIEIEFATRNVFNYDATILSCMSGGRGIIITAQKAIFKSEQSEISTQYKEDEHVRISFVTEKRSEHRLLYIYINGIMSGVIQYPDDDDFSQPNPVNIAVGSNDCTIDLYCIRIYDNDLTREQILNNWIADTQIGSLMMDRYNRNNIYDAYGNVVISKLPNDLPYFIIECPELPQYKGDKKICSGSFVNPTLPSKSYTFTNCQIDVQGTSSQYYPRKNYKLKFNDGFVTPNGTISKYGMNSTSIPVKTFCFKADFASSEKANNVELVRLYNSICPYKTPAQLENPNVRQGIDGFPMVIFWNNGSETVFLGCANYNNDKSTEEVFGFEEPDESIETLNNTGLWALFKSADYSGTGYLADFEWRFPDTDPPFTDPSQLKEFAEWVVQTDTDAATNNNLPQSVTYDGVTYTKDTAEYRLAKFKNEAWDYMEKDSTLFYYLFTELFLMVDSRAKNAFPSFIGSAVS